MEAFVAIAVLMFVAAIVDAVYKSQRIKKARAEYQVALERLRQMPTNADLRIAALQRGREFCQLTRGGGRVAEEVAIKNDVDAVTAGSVAFRP